MKIQPTSLSNVFVIEPDVYEDERGYFAETFNRREFEKAGLPTQFVQDNLSGSRHGVLRGLHYQIQQSQGKLVRVIRGEVFDVAVDLRKSSPQFGEWFGVVLSGDNRKSLWIPPGFAHGFLVLSAFADFAYKTTAFYAPQHERTILWNDPEIGIRWPSTSELIISSKDQGGLRLAEAQVYEAELTV